jgi:hypothetical protein
VRRDPRTALKAKEVGITHLVREVDDKQDMCDLHLVSLNFEVIDTVAGTGYEVPIHVARITLDDNKMLLWKSILFNLESWAEKDTPHM